MTDRPDKQNRHSGGLDGDDHSPAALYHAALGALIRALESDDERVSLRAAQIVFDLLKRTPPPARSSLPDTNKVIVLRYGELPTGNAEQDDRRDQSATSRPGASAGFDGPLQSGGLWSALGQDGDGQAGRD